MAEKKSLSGYWRTTFLIGLGFFTMGLMDPLYDNYIPMFLGYYIESSSLVGAVMTLDNILAIFLIPIFSALSDRTRTRIGRRMPYIVTLLPLAAIFFALVPFSALKSLFMLCITIFLLNIFKQAVRGPVVALMPDMVPADLRSEANGVINTMGGLATILGTVLLARLMDVKVHLPGIGETDKILAFPVASVFVIIAVVLLFSFVKEKSSTVATEDERNEKPKEPLLKSLKGIFSEKEKSALYILLSLLCWFIAYQGILPFIGVYTMEELGTSAGTAALSSGMVGVAYAAFAVPSGKVAHRFGRRRTIRVALFAIVAHAQLFRAAHHTKRFYVCNCFFDNRFFCTNKFCSNWCQYANHSRANIWCAAYDLQLVIGSIINGQNMQIFTAWVVFYINNFCRNRFGCIV